MAAVPILNGFDPLRLWTVEAVAAVILVSLLFVRTYNRVKPLPVSKDLPGPDRYPFVGILPFVDRYWEDWPETLLRMNSKFRRTWGGPLPNFGALPGAFIYVLHERNVKYILNDNFDNYVKGDVWWRSFRELLGDGIFSSDGSMWVKHRKITANMFSRNLLRHTALVTRTKLNEMSDKLDTEIRQDGVTVVDVQDLFHRFTFDTTSLVAFGREYNSIQSESPHPFTLAFDEMQSLILDRIKDPLYELKRYLCISQRERRISALKKVLDRYAKEIISGKRRSVDEGCELGPDILSRFIDHSVKHKEPLLDEELRDVIMNILIAGRDTTACALSWAMFELTKQPSVVDQIVKEANAVCGIGTEADYSYDTIAKLRYTHAVAMEVLRLHPSVPNDIKYAVHNDTLPDGTFIPAGALIGYLPYAMGRDTHLWGDDALSFRPERFLESKEPSPYKYPVFNAGPRICLGKPLALTTMKMTLAYLLPKYNFADKAGHSGAYNWKLVLQMKGGFPMQVSKKKRK